jgi:hypothetical protein
MQQIKETLISDDLLEKAFVCDLNACKGACCVEGDSGAPLDEDELKVFEEIFDKVQPYLPEESLNRIKEVGKYLKDEDGDWSTPLLDDGTCVYVTRDEKGILKCGIEAAYNDKKIDFKKPISCHLFPVRLKEYKTFTAVNVQLLEICSDACALGKQLQVPVYQFLEESLRRKFGDAWYEKLKEIAISENE